ncbi:hypothetical protein JRO89_XS07G0012400 [Xanthoceras sorbifolium]|uniref:MaoC-like domain-containing protein n=1 Tax=Xanthoceras sorbifolium TaxID=99658 RepID=A0ABQ8HRW0_9ROSI|nr:hypothetical protein JRO89_XS07G0012400 [Xanthoceras sorbifolium]
MANSSEFNPELLLSHKYPQTTYTYTERDVVIYALGIGSCGGNAVDVNELKFVYHENGQQFVKVLPTFSALFTLKLMPTGALELPGLQYDPRLLLHGQHYIEIYKPLPSNASIRNETILAGLHDKGKAAIAEMETRSYEKESGELLCMNRMTAFLRGAGGFSKSSQPFSYSNYPANQVTAVKIPKTQPFAVLEDTTQPSQACNFDFSIAGIEIALLYRLSGDYNPLHSDPMVAKVAGTILDFVLFTVGIIMLPVLYVNTVSLHFTYQRFSRPILHGLCTLGFAVRAIIKCICRGDPDMVKNISGRFLLHVYPDETLITEMWLDGLRVIYQVKVRERNRTVLSGFVDLHRLASSL